MNKIYSESKIDAVCGRLARMLQFLNEHGPDIMREDPEPIYELLDELKKMADNVACHCRLKY